MPEEPEVLEPQIKCHEHEAPKTSVNTVFIHPLGGVVSTEKSIDLNRIQIFDHQHCNLGTLTFVAELAFEIGDSLFYLIGVFSLWVLFYIGF